MIVESLAFTSPNKRSSAYQFRLLQAGSMDDCWKLTQDGPQSRPYLSGRFWGGGM